MSAETATAPAAPAVRIKKSILGRKLGMSQIFNERGEVVPVTVVEAGPCRILQVKTKAKDGYNALQIGFGSRRPKTLTRPELGHVVPAGGAAGQARKVQLKQALAEKKPVPAYVKEIPWDGQGEPKVGDEITAASFEGLLKVDVVGTMKGRGFAGVVKRYGFAGGPKTHGQSDRHRAPGSVGSTTHPGHVWRGTRMAGHMGAAAVTVRGLEVVLADADRNMVLIRGAVPGWNNGVVRIEKLGKMKKKLAPAPGKQQDRKAPQQQKQQA